MIIDTHAHVFSSQVLQRRAAYAEQDRWFGLLNPPGSRRLASAARLVSTMDACAVDVAAAVSFGWANQSICEEQNDELLAACARFPGRLLPFCAVQPLAGTAAIRELERVARLGCRGIGELFPDGQGFSLADANALAPLLEACQGLGLVLLVHSSEPVGREYAGKGRSTPDQLLALAGIARWVAPALPIICAHLGGGLPFYALMPEVRAQLESLWFDTGAAAYLYDPAAIQHVAALVPGRLLFGSDFPVIGMQRMLDYVRQAPLSVTDAAAILGGNAAQLFNLPPP